MKYDHTHNDNCRAYYTEKRRLYCLQRSIGHEYEAFSCSRDGEPSHHVHRPKKDFPPPTGDTATDREVRNWLDS